MGWMTRAASRRAAMEMRAIPGATTAAEVFESDAETSTVLTPDVALTVAAVFACVRLLSDTISTLPAAAFRRVGNVRKPYDDPAWLRKPNPDMGRIAFFGTVMTSLLLEGNAFILVTRRAGRVVALDVIPASMVHPRYVRLASGRSVLVYELTATGEDSAVQVIGALSASDVLHLRGIPLAGSLRGVSPLCAAATTIGLAIHAQEYGAEFFANGATPGAVVEVPGAMTPEGMRAARRTWRQLHGGKGNRHGLALLTEGAKYTKVSISPDEAQFLETRQFQISDVARIFGVPPHLIADASGSTSWGSGLAEQNIAFAQHSVRVWVERLEEAFTALLVSETRDESVFVKFNLDAMQRGSIKDRFDGYRTGLQNGIYTRNEVRALEDLPPDTSEFGDMFALPTNLALLGPDGPIQLAPKAPAPEPEPEPEDDVETEDVEPDGEADDNPKGDDKPE